MRKIPRDFEKKTMETRKKQIKKEFFSPAKIKR